MNAPLSDRPTTSESNLGDGMLEKLCNCAGEGAENLKLVSGASPAEIMKAIDAEIKRIQSSNENLPESPFDDGPIHLGSLWGQQLVEAFQWEWVQLTFHAYGDSKAFGLVAPNRAWVVCPFEYIFGCLQNNVTPFAELSFDMLDVCRVADTKGGEHQAILRQSGVPTAPPNSYQNLMAEFSEHGNA